MFVTARLAGQADLSVPITFLDSVTGAPETGVTSATAGLEIWYRREDGLKVVLASVGDLAALTDAHSDEDLLHVSNGEYRLDLPDAAGAAGKRYVQWGGSATGMVALGGWIDLLAYDPLAVDLTALAASIAAILVDTDTTIPGLISGPLAESYHTHGDPATLAQLNWAIYSTLTNMLKEGTLLTVRKQDTTTAFTLTLDHPTNPTSSVRNP